MRQLNRIAVFCGSSNRPASHYFESARAFGALLGTRGIGLVYGGGHTGLMGAVADGCLEVGGVVIGVIPEQLVSLELAHEGCTELHVVADMHERKMKMAQLSDAFVALPGGFGTLEELFEAVTWTQLNIHFKPVGLLDPTGFYRQLQAFLDHASGEGFIRPPHRGLVLSSETGPDLLDALASSRIPRLDEWIESP